MNNKYLVEVKNGNLKRMIATTNLDNFVGCPFVIVETDEKGYMILNGKYLDYKITREESKLILVEKSQLTNKVAAKFRVGEYYPDLDFHKIAGV